MEQEEIIPNSSTSTSKRRKIEETVINILKNADLETATEYSVRAETARQLNTDLSDFADKCLIRQVLESFLLSTAATTPLESDDVNINNTHNVSASEKNQESSINTNGRIICKVSWI